MALGLLSVHYLIIQVTLLATCYGLLLDLGSDQRQTIRLICLQVQLLFSTAACARKGPTRQEQVRVYPGGFINLPYAVCCSFLSME